MAKRSRPSRAKSARPPAAPAAPVSRQRDAAPSPPAAAAAAEPYTGGKPKVGGQLKVRAIRDGYYDNKLRRVGDVFFIETSPRSNDPSRMQNFSDKWMERVDPLTPEKITTNNEVLRQQHDETLAARAGGTAAPATGDSTPLGE